MAVGAERFSNGDRVPKDATFRGQAPYKVDRRSSQGREKPLDAGSVGPIVLEILGGGLCSAVGVVRLT
jgi:hypothetical protein